MSFQIPKTVSGHNMFECASALQKSIRRGLVDDAIYWAVEMYLSNFGEYCWRRLLVISSEDIGLGNPDVALVIRSLRDSYVELNGKSPKYCPERLMLVHAVMYLATSPKSRVVNDALLYHFKAHDDLYREVPDYALDMHTQRGKAKKRGTDHFFSEAAVIRPFPLDAAHDLLVEVDQGIDRYEQDAKSVVHRDNPPFPTKGASKKRPSAKASDCEHGPDRSMCMICTAEDYE